MDPTRTAAAGGTGGGGAASNAGAATAGTDNLGGGGTAREIASANQLQMQSRSAELGLENLIDQYQRQAAPNSLPFWGSTPIWSGSVSMSPPMNTNSNLSVLSRVLRRIHREIGPAVYLDNGGVLYFWHGVNVPEWVVMTPEKITVRHIMRERNIELRRILIERFGQGKFIKELGAVKIHEDKFGTLWEATRDRLLTSQTDSLSNADVRQIFGTNRRLKYVQVRDASTDREYFLPVPSTMKRARQDCAWTFGLKEEEYKPQKET